MENAIMQINAGAQAYQGRDRSSKVSDQSDTGKDDFLSLLGGKQKEAEQAADKKPNKANQSEKETSDNPESLIPQPMADNSFVIQQNDIRAQLLLGNIVIQMDHLNVTEKDMPLPLIPVAACTTQESNTGNTMLNQLNLPNPGSESADILNADTKPVNTLKADPQIPGEVSTDGKTVSDSNTIQKASDLLENGSEPAKSIGADTKAEGMDIQSGKEQKDLPNEQGISSKGLDQKNQTDQAGIDITDKIQTKTNSADQNKDNSEVFVAVEEKEPSAKEVLPQQPSVSEEKHASENATRLQEPKTDILVDNSTQVHRTMPKEPNARIVHDVQPQANVKLAAGSQEELLQKLSDQILLKTMANQKEFEVQLEPANLGKMAIKVAYGLTGTTISIECTSQKTLDMLSQGVKNVAYIMESHLGTPTTVYVEQDVKDYLNQREQQQGQQQGQQQQKQDQDNKSDRDTTIDFLQQLRLGLIQGIA